MKKNVLFFALLTIVLAFNACTNENDSADDTNDFARLQADIEIMTNDVKTRPLISQVTDSYLIPMAVWSRITEIPT